MGFLWYDELFLCFLPRSWIDALVSQGQVDAKSSSPVPSGGLGVFFFNDLRCLSFCGLGISRGGL